MYKHDVSFCRLLKCNLTVFPNDIDPEIIDQFFMGYITALYDFEKLNATSYDELCHIGVDGFLDFCEFLGI